ncbi:FKBP-type peptidyl-prolyl cis-trans isomerase N-terminal domain-containing protein [Geopsychrobacter electrodiphilus]|uniref:FKBP-type peptidyl-prolyl cis-trans isomerase N-terminal domain-containing protein n=1 Tax=Geopsychrobacter electrodiphilus TaxID=225196 RepID=UPI00036891A3|nr:FKBP-type peptidyl-prolyl cis-trans isomerase N-terminal domain-containing protein [Geopsychrobacter electrodiphilus]
MKKHVFVTIALSLFCTACAFAATKVDLKDETAQISYSLGYQIGGDFKSQGVGLDATAVVEGIQDAIASNEPRIAPKEMTALLVALKQKVVADQRTRNYQTTKAYLAANLKKEGVKELPGGTQYRVIKAGSGASPKASDTVDIHFTTKRTDGTTIATTRSDNSTPRTYPISKMLPGLQTALVKMKPGAEWEVFVAPGGRTESLEAGGVLIYDLELVAVHPAAGKKN